MGNIPDHKIFIELYIAKIYKKNNTMQYIVVIN